MPITQKYKKMGACLSKL